MTPRLPRLPVMPQDVCFLVDGAQITIPPADAARLVDALRVRPDVEAQTAADRIERAGGLRSEPVGRAEQPAGGGPFELPVGVRGRLSDEVIDELLAGALTEEEIVGSGGVLPN